MADSKRYHKRPVICIETGEEYESIYQAAKTVTGDTRQNNVNIYLCCTGKKYRNRNGYYPKKTCRGYHWKFKEA